MQIKNTAKEYDVIIVGSGAGGGMATKILSLGPKAPNFGVVEFDKNNNAI